MWSGARWMALAMVLLGSGCAVFLDLEPFAVEDAVEDPGVEVSDEEDLAEDPAQDPGLDVSDAETVEEVDEPEVDAPVVNRCGGLGPLRHRDGEGEPGGSCGAFDEGILVCSSLTTLLCLGEAERNACGGRGRLPVELGTPCGPCADGIWACDGAQGVACLGAQEPNGCGGCDPLAGRPGSRCTQEGERGTWACTTRESLLCLAGRRNACGGDGELQWEGDAAEPGMTCATACGSEDGVLICATASELVCIPTARATPPNACGGCGPLPGTVGVACGICGDGVWQCNGNTMVCAGASAVDACGGCSGETQSPGTACGPSSQWSCEGSALLCTAQVPEATRNVCGGLSTLVGEPGDSCGTCNRGGLVCATQNQLSCVGDVEGNLCGGCEVQPGRAGEACGVCGTGRLECDGTSLRCAGDGGASARNACGGCGALGAGVDTPCGPCLSWQCTAAGGLSCKPDPDAEGCTDLVTCDELGCADLSRRCVDSDGESDARCTGCLAGYTEVDGACVEARSTCDDLDCSDEHRSCEEGDEGNDAVCGACLPGYLEEDESCRALLDCDDLSCAAVHRSCVEGDDEQDAVCGGCLSGYRVAGESCALVVTCSALDCGSENRACDAGGALDDAVCSSCLPGYLEESGSCRAVETCGDLDCAAEHRSCSEGEESEDATCGACLAGYRPSGELCELVVTCEALACGSENRVCEAGGALDDALCGACLGGFEEVATVCVPPLGVPQGVTASSGTSTSHVTVGWQEVAGATGYHVYRNGTRVTTAPVSGLTYDDPGAPSGGVPGVLSGVQASEDRPLDVEVTWAAATSPEGTPASYRVRAVSSSQESALSSEETGYRGALEVVGYEVRIDAGSWTPVGLTESWTDTEAPAGSVTVGVPTATQDDPERVELSVVASSTTEGATRDYRVRAVNAAGAGSPSDGVLGRRSVGSVSYQWQWSTTSGGSYTNLSGATSRTASDTEIGEGVTRWYRVVVSAAGASEVTSSAVQGRRASSTLSLGSACTSDGQCPSGAWCPTNTSERRCSPRPSMGGVAMPFQWVPRGTFTLGSPSSETGRFSNEGQVEVELTRDYFVQRTPVTQGQWEAVMTAWNALPSGQRVMNGWSGATPTFGTTPSCFRSTSGTSCTTSGSHPTGPVERVSWWDAVVYANALSVLEGLTPCYTLSGCGTGTGVSGVGGGCSGTSGSCTSGIFSCSGVTFVGKSCTGYRLLTEAEWERAARGGTSTATYLGNLSGTVNTCSSPPAQPNLDPIAWWCGNSGNRTQVVGGKTPNAWGLYDMLGNVWEWTWTWYAASQSGGVDPLGPVTGSLRVRRGGSWFDGARFARAGLRSYSDPGNRSSRIGFRLARTAP